MQVVAAVLLPTLMTMISCGPADSPDTRAADAAAIQALDEQWSAAAAKNDLEGALAFYSDDAVLLPPNAPIAADKAGIRAAWTGLLTPNTNVKWKVAKVEVARSGDMAYLYGAYDVTVKDPKGGPPFTEKGKLLEIWKKQADGKWKCAVDTFNSDAPAPAPPAPAK